jgi:hypothetical protein
MESQEEAAREYLASLKKGIESMPPMERACSMAVLNLGNMVAALVNTRDWKPIEELEKVCSEMFTDVRRIKEEANRYKVQ